MLPSLRRQASDNRDGSAPPGAFGGSSGAVPAGPVVAPVVKFQRWRLAPPDVSIVGVVAPPPTPGARVPRSFEAGSPVRPNARAAHAGDPRRLPGPPARFRPAPAPARWDAP